MHQVNQPPRGCNHDLNSSFQGFYLNVVAAAAVNRKHVKIVDVLCKVIQVASSMGAAADGKTITIVDIAGKSEVFRFDEGPEIIGRQSLEYLKRMFA